MRNDCTLYRTLEHMEYKITKKLAHSVAKRSLPQKKFCRLKKTPYLCPTITKERCRSGRSGRSRKPLYPYGYPGFESLSFRNLVRRKTDNLRQTSDFQ